MKAPPPRPEPSHGAADVEALAFGCAKAAAGALLALAALAYARQWRRSRRRPWPLGPAARVVASIAADDPDDLERNCASSLSGDEAVADVAGLLAPSELAPLRPCRLDELIGELEASVRPWVPGSFGLVRTLQDAPRNQGRVDLMRSHEDGDRLVAVKRVPNHWITPGQREFAREHPNSNEKPWSDLGILKALGGVGYPYSFELLDVFRDAEYTYIETPVASEGDLFEWCSRDPRPSREREIMMQPLVVQICSAVRWLHELGLVHRDISVENILIDVDASGTQQVKLIDFGMSVLSRSCSGGVRCKASYQAPEESECGLTWDGFMADTFAVGVTIFVMAAHDYPWASTRAFECQRFQYVQASGFCRFLKKRKLRNGNGEVLMDVFSNRLVKLLEGLLQVRPEKRLTLGQSCWANDCEADVERPSVWQQRWLTSSLAKPIKSPRRRPDEWTLESSSVLQEVIDCLFVGDEHLRNLSFSLTIADPRADGCPLIGCSAGFTALCGYSMDEIIGRNCRFLVDPVPKEFVDLETRRGAREFCDAVRDGREPEPLLPANSRGQWVSPLSVEGGIFCVQTNARKDGTLFQNMFFLMAIELEHSPFIVGLQTQLPDMECHAVYEEACRCLSANMEEVERCLASRFWVTAPMRRSVM